MGTVVWGLQLSDGRVHQICQSRTDKECVEPYFHHSYVLMRCYLEILMAAKQAGVVEKHISLLVCGTPNDATLQLYCLASNDKKA
jgi:hypothetical protein